MMKMKMKMKTPRIARRFSLWTQYMGDLETPHAPHPTQALLPLQLSFRPALPAQAVGALRLS